MPAKLRHRLAVGARHGQVDRPPLLCASKPRSRPATAKLATRRLTSHSNGPGSVSSKSLMSKTSRRSGAAKAPKLERCASPQSWTCSPVRGAVGEIGRHQVGGAAEERERRDEHPPVADRHQLRHARRSPAPRAGRPGRAGRRPAPTRRAPSAAPRPAPPCPAPPARPASGASAPSPSPGPYGFAAQTLRTGFRVAVAGRQPIALGCLNRPGRAPGILDVRHDVAPFAAPRNRLNAARVRQPSNRAGIDAPSSRWHEIPDVSSGEAGCPRAW